MSTVYSNQSKKSSNFDKKSSYYYPRHNVVNYKAILHIFIFYIILTPVFAYANSSILGKNYEYSSLSKMAYRDDVLLGEVFYLDGKEATVIKVETDENDYGFSAIVVEVDGEIIVAFRGTEDGDKFDLSTDLGLILNNPLLISKQYNSTLKFVNELQSDFPNRDFSFTGHSLGGSIAQYAGIIFGGKTVTYNAAPISKYAFSFFNLSTEEIEERGRDILNIRQAGDPISEYFGGNFLNVGSNVVVDTGLCSSVVCHHSIDYLVSTSLSERLENRNTTGARQNTINEEPNNNENSRDEKIIWVEGLDFDEDPIVIFDPNAPPIFNNDENNTSNETVLVVTKNDDGEVLIGNNAGTQIILLSRPTEPTGPTPEEISAQIADLRAERNSYSITQQDAEARLQERRNRLTVLQFNELEKVQNAGSLVRSRISELRVEQSGVGFSAADQQLLLDLVTYEDTLQTEQERIAQDITRTNAKILEYQTELGRLETQLDDNESKLVKLRYNLTDYTPPTFIPEGLTDWSNYEYELPPFNETEQPETVARLAMISAAHASPTSSFLLTHGATATVTTDGSSPTTIVSDNGPLSLTATNPASENYQYLSWGTYLGSVISYLDTKTDETHALENIRWLYGEATPSSYFLNKTGTASWTGNVHGDYALAGSDQTFYDAVTGDLGFTVNFSDNSVAGNLTTHVNYTPSAASTISSNSNFTLEGQFMTGEINGTSGAGIDTQILSFGGTEVGGLGGAFFGPNAEEFGGTFHYFDSTGGASGIVVAQLGVFELPTKLKTLNNWLGFGMTTSGVKFPQAAALYSSHDGQQGEFSQTGDNTLTATSCCVTYSPSSFQTSTDDHNQAIQGDTGSYNYSSWGVWDEADQLVSGSSTNSGYWVGGMVTPDSSRPQIGTATYKGALIGNYTNNNGQEDIGSITGSVDIDVSFSDNQISGTLSMDRNGSAWKDANFSDTLDGSRFSAGFSNEPGGVYGYLHGPNAEEASGAWFIPEATGTAVGIFRATQ